MCSCESKDHVIFPAENGIHFANEAMGIKMSEILQVIEKKRLQQTKTLLKTKHIFLGKITFISQHSLYLKLYTCSSVFLNFSPIQKNEISQTLQNTH